MKQKQKKGPPRNKKKTTTNKQKTQQHTNKTNQTTKAIFHSSQNFQFHTPTTTTTTAKKHIIPTKPAIPQTALAPPLYDANYKMNIDDKWIYLFPDLPSAVQANVLGY